MRKVITNYEKLTQAEFDKILTKMIQSLTANANFPNLPKAITDIASKQTSWQTELVKSQAGDHQATANANAMQGDLLSWVKENGDYINNTSQGNVAKLESSGYTLAKEPVYQNKEKIKFVQGENSGTGNIVIDAIPNAVVYLVEIAPDPVPAPDNDSKWERQKMSTKATIPVKGLIPRKLYWMRFCYVTVEDEMDYCEPVSFSAV